MGVATLIIAYNEEEYIRQSIQQWSGIVDHILVLVSTEPWNGTIVENNTAELARNTGAMVVEGYWKTEEEQRNYGLAMLYDYDYVIINDPDEFYTLEDRKKIIAFCKEPLNDVDNKRFCGAICKEMVTYWKTPEYVFDPPDKHKPFIAVDPKLVLFNLHRVPREIKKNFGYLTQRGIIDVVCHHMSWVHSDEKILEKISSYSHSKEISKYWYDDVWKDWKEGDSTMIRPYGIEKSIASKRTMPNEIFSLIFSL